MSGDALGERKASLENAFFAKQDVELRRRMAEKESAQARRAALAETSGIRDEAVLDKLVAMNINSETLAAMSLVPLVAVAWADGTIDPNERSAVLRAAEQEGLSKQSANYELLNGWLAKMPPPDLITVWKQYVAALVANLDDPARTTLKTQIMGRARSVAEASGGFLGLTARISDAEKRILHDLEEIFQAPPVPAATV